MIRPDQVIWRVLLLQATLFCWMSKRSLNLKRKRSRQESEATQLIQRTPCVLLGKHPKVRELNQLL